MKLRNILLAVKDIEKSRQFYHELFGLQTVLNSEGNMILTEGLVLQEEKIWKKFLEKDVIPQNNSCELYFEEREIEKFVQKLKPDLVASGVKEKYVFQKMGLPFRQMHSWDYSGPYHGYDAFAIFAKDMDLALNSPVWAHTKAPWESK